MTTDLADLFRETVEAVDGACQCRTTYEDECGGSPSRKCPCACGDERECLWPGHATIRERLGKIAEQEHADVLTDCCECEAGIVDDECAALRVRLKEAINGR